MKKVEKKVNEYREKRVELWYAKKINEKKNLEAKIKKIDREIKKFKPEEYEIEIERSKEQTATWTSPTYTITGT